MYWKGNDPSERLYPFHGPNFIYIYILSPFNLIPCLIFTQYSFVHLYLSLRGYIYMLAGFQVGFWSKLEAIHLVRYTDICFTLSWRKSSEHRFRRISIKINGIFWFCECQRHGNAYSGRYYEYQCRFNLIKNTANSNWNFLRYFIIN